MKQSSSNENTMTRRTFIDRSAVAAVGAALLGDTKTASASSLSATSYERVIGANDRIKLGHVGIGNRGRGLEYILSQLKDSIEQIRATLNPRLEIQGVVLTMHDARTSLSREVADNVRAFFGPKVYETVIPRNTRIAEASAFAPTMCVSAVSPQ